MKTIFTQKWMEKKEEEKSIELKKVEKNSPLLASKRVYDFPYLLSKGDTTSCSEGGEQTVSFDRTIATPIIRVKKNEFMYTTQASGHTGMWNRHEYSYSLTWTLVSEKAEREYQKLVEEANQKNTIIREENRLILIEREKKIKEIEEKYKNLTPTKKDLESTEYFSEYSKKMLRAYPDALRRYEDLMERSKTEVMTSTRIREIKELELVIKWVQPTLVTWVQPKLARQMTCTFEEYEVYSEESQDEEIEKVICEVFGLSINDLNSDWEGGNGRGSVKVEFGENYSFVIKLNGDIQLGSMGCNRLKLKKETI